MAYPEFRNQLDRLLRSKDSEGVRQFLVAQGQWPDDSSIDVERAMWMMIAGAPTLQELHAEAQTWLMQQGYQSEAEMLRQRDSAPPQSSSAKSGAKTGARPGSPGSETRGAEAKKSGQPRPKPASGQSAKQQSKPPTSLKRPGP